MSLPDQPVQGAYGHTWRSDWIGGREYIDYEERDTHGGPVCVTCGYWYCLNCDKEPAEDCVLKAPADRPEET